MIQVEVTYILKQGKREDFYHAIVEQGIDTAAQSEAGNLRYDFEFAEDNADILYLHEQWENEEVLRAHATMPHYQALGKLKEQYVLQTVIEKGEHA